MCYMGHLARRLLLKRMVGPNPPTEPPMLVAKVESPSLPKSVGHSSSAHAMSTSLPSIRKPDGPMLQCHWEKQVPYPRDFCTSLAFYNLSGRDQGMIRTNRNRYLERVFAHASGLGQQPVIICMDANTSIKGSHCLSTAISSGMWTDFGPHFTNNNPLPTFSSSKNRNKIRWGKNVTRPDMIFANKAALHICTAFRLRRGLSPKGHLGLELAISMDRACLHYQTFKPPRQFCTKAKPTSERDYIAQAAIAKHRDSFEKARLSDPDRAWRVFAAISEDFLRKCQPMDKPIGQGGRHGRVRFHQENVTQAAASKKHPGDVCTFALQQAFKHVRRSSELRFKLQQISSSDGDDDYVFPNKQFESDCLTLTQKIRLFSRKLNIRLPQDKPFLSVANLLEFDEALDTYISQLQKCQSTNRINAWRHMLRCDFKAGGKKTYAWLKDESKPPITAVTSLNGQIATDPDDVVHCIQQTWDSLFNQSQQPRWEPFSHFNEFLQAHPCPYEPITADDILAHIRSMSNHRAVALDGWRVTEMKQLPRSILALAADLYQDIEKNGVWPQNNCFAYISCVPKTTPVLDNTDASTIFAPLAFDTRPISNISLWSTTYSGIRFKQMATWRNTWMPCTMHGARQGHETSDVSFELQLLLENAGISKRAISGISLDRKKFFDLLPHDLCFQILNALGAPQSIINAERAFYKQLCAIYKANQAFTQNVSHCTSGFIQGCSFSLQAALGLLAIWTKYIEATPVPAHISLSTGGFLDDNNNNMRSAAATAADANTALLQAWQRFLQFDQLAGIQVNTRKTICFANTGPGRKLIAEILCAAEFGFTLVNSFKLVGGVITASGKPEIETRARRVQKASDRLKRGRYAPLSFSQKVNMIQSAIMPVALYGCELQPLTQRECDNLRRRVSSCLYKGHSWCR